MTKDELSVLGFALCLMQAAMAGDHKAGRHGAGNRACAWCALKFLLALAAG